MEFQTRDNDGGLRFFATLAEAMEYANKTPDVWKVSFSLPNGERVRLVYINGNWIYSQIN